MEREEFLNRKIDGCSEFVLGCIKLQPGETLPLHFNAQAECNYILSGRAWARLGRRRVEIAADSATYFPPGKPHAYEVIGNEPFRYVFAFATEKIGQVIKNEPADEKAAEDVDIVNMWKDRWAVADDFVPWQLWEPSKGKRGMTWKSLFDSEAGNCEAMMFGTCFLPPGCRYSRHSHEQPEVFYGIEGRGQLLLNGRHIDMMPGKAVYVPKKGVHGAQNLFAEPMRMIWIYGTETAGSDWSWTPAEDIYLDAQRSGASIDSF